MDIRDKIKNYIAKNLLFSESGFPYPDDASFLDGGIVDSIGVMELVSFVGDEFGIDVDPGDIIPENFDSVERMSQYVQRKQTVGQS